MPTTAPAGDKLAVEQNGRMRAWSMRWLRMAAGLAYGSVTAVVELIIVAVCGLALALTAPWPAARTRLRAHIDRTTARLAAVELRRLRRRRIGAGEAVIDPLVVRRLLEQHDSDPLRELTTREREVAAREREVAALMAEGAHETRARVGDVHLT